MLRLRSSRGDVWTRMQPSGQAWAQVEQPVQRSSNQSRLVRALTGTGRISSGYWTVNGRRKRVRSVTIIPLAIPVPNKRAPSGGGRAPALPDACYSQGKFYTYRLLYFKAVVKEFTQCPSGRPGGRLPTCARRRRPLCIPARRRLRREDLRHA